MQLLLLSNSTIKGQPYLQWPREHINSFLGAKPMRLAFVPYAVVTMSQDDHARETSTVFTEMGHEMFSLHTESNPAAALDKVDGIVIGGGNSFQLLRLLYKYDLVRAMNKHIKKGKKFIGWSAGANVAGPTIMTTNDMPITEPPTFRSLQLVAFQINPHYTDKTIEGHGGESRDQRIQEYLELHPHMTVAGLPEGALLHVNKEQVTVKGTGLRVFRKGSDPKDVAEGTILPLNLRVH